MKLQKLNAAVSKTAVPPQNQPNNTSLIEKGLDRWIKLEKQFKQEVTNLSPKMQSLFKMQQSVQELNLEAQLVSQAVEGVSGCIKKLTQNG